MRQYSIDARGRPLPHDPMDTRHAIKTLPTLYRALPQSALRPLRVLRISSRRSSIAIESAGGACTRK